VDPSSLQLANEGLDSSLWAWGSFPYHVEDEGPSGADRGRPLHPVGALRA
jgi:hypothetical protein